MTTFCLACNISGSIFLNHIPQFLFGTQYKRHSFFAIFHEASGQKHQQATTKGDEDGSH
jgi:hypothetical protein